MPAAVGPAGDPLERRINYSAYAAALLLFIPLLVPLASGRIFTIDDLTALNLPLRHIYQSALRAGHSILWTSQLYGGFYIHAEGEVGALHPLHLLLYRTLPLTVAFNLELILSYVFGFAGMWLFLRRVGLATASSVVGGISYAFSGFALLHLPHMNAVAVVAHAPWLLLAIELSFEGTTAAVRKGVVGVSLLLASQALLGHPQSIEMSGLICLLYCLVCVRGPLTRLILVASSAAAGLLLAGIQIVPTFDLLATSARRIVSPEFALSYSLHPLNILQLFSPYLLLNRVYAAPDERYVHEFAIYNGALATVAIAWAILRRRQLPFARLAVFASATCIVGLLLALGRYGVVYEWFSVLPIVGKFRAPARHIVLVHFGLAVLVSILFEDVRRLSAVKTRSIRGGILLWAPVLLSAAAALVAWIRPQLWMTFPDQPLNGEGMLIGGFVLGLATILVSDAARGSRAALMLLPWVLAVDLGIWGYSYVFAGGVDTVGAVVAAVDAPPAQPGATIHQAARKPKLNLLLMHDLRMLRPAVGLPPIRTLKLSTDDELRVSGAEWVSDGDEWRRIDHSMPRVRFVPEWRIGDDPTDLSGIDIERVALVTENPHVASPAAGSATLVVDEPGRMVVDVSSRTGSLLVTTEAYDDGWRATGPSGAALHTMPVYGDYLGIVVTPGDYQLSLSFEPQSMRRGILASLAGAVLVGLLAAFVSWKQ